MSACALAVKLAVCTVLDPLVFAGNLNVRVSAWEQDHVIDTQLPHSSLATSAQSAIDAVLEQEWDSRHELPGELPKCAWCSTAWH